MTPGGRGLQVAIDRAGQLVVDPAWQGAKGFPHDRRPWPPVRLGAPMRPGDWNTLTLRVERRRLSILVNGHPAAEPIDLPYDLVPSMPQLAVYKPDFGTHVRAEFEDVSVRDLGEAP